MVLLGLEDLVVLLVLGEDLSLFSASEDEDWWVLGECFFVIFVILDLKGVTLVVVLVLGYFQLVLTVDLRLVDLVFLLVLFLVLGGLNIVVFVRWCS